MLKLFNLCREAIKRSSDERLELNFVSKLFYQLVVYSATNCPMFQVRNCEQ